MDLYRENILDHYNNPRNYGRLPKPSATSAVVNELCGDKLTVDILVYDPKKGDDQKSISHVAFEGEGCAISMASASLLSEFSENKTMKELKSLTSNDIVKLLGVPLTPTRLKCALLALEALHEAIGRI